MLDEFLFYNGKVLTQDEANPSPEAVLIQNGKIKALGSYNMLKNELHNSANSLNLEGRVLMPAIIDAHTHFFEMVKYSTFLDLSTAKSVEDISVLVQNYRQTVKPNCQWIRGWGWDLNKYQDANLLDRHFLDRVFPDIPVTFDSHDLHSKWCNSLALKIANINKDTPNPPGGSIGKDKNGELTGFLFELAWELINRVIPEFSDSEKQELVKHSAENMWQYGISGVNVMEGKDRYLIYKDIAESGFPFRFFWHFPSDCLDEIIEYKSKYYHESEMIKTCGMKVFMDGSLGSHTAYMFDPYPDSDNYGTTAMSFDNLYYLMKKAALHDIPTTVHSIGDRCSYEIIKLFIKLKKETNPTLNHRIEHLQALRPQDMALLKESGVSCAMQPIHMKADIEYIDQLWPNASKYAFPLKTLMDNNIPLAFSSDAPVETINPFEGIYSAIERKYKNNPDNPSWYPNERISDLQALKAYTLGSAKLSGAEANLGSISIGKSADLIVIDNFFEENTNFWLTAKSKFSMIHGEIVYRVI